MTRHVRPAMTSFGSPSCRVRRAFTYVSTWAGRTYVVFVIDAYARRIPGWRAATTMTADLVFDAVEQAIWTRQHEDRADFTALVTHHDHGSQYLSVAHTQRLADAGIKPSVGAVGSSYDNALAESINGLYKTEVIRRRGPWRDVNAYYEKQQPQQQAEESKNQVSGRARAVQIPPGDKSRDR